MLKDYMGYFVDKHGEERRMSFYGYVLSRHPETVKGTYHHAKRLATNCYYCGKTFQNHREKTVDHFIPVSKGGRNDSRNNSLIICCKECNQTKKDTHPKDLMKQLSKSFLTGKPLFGTEKRTKKVFESVSQISSAMEYGVQNKLYYKQCFRLKEAPFVFELKNQK